MVNRAVSALVVIGACSGAESDAGHLRGAREQRSVTTEDGTFAIEVPRGYEQFHFEDRAAEDPGVAYFRKSGAKDAPKLSLSIEGGLLVPVANVVETKQRIADGRELVCQVTFRHREHSAEADALAKSICATATVEIGLRRGE